MNLKIKCTLQAVLSIATMWHTINAQGLNPDRGVTFHLRAVCAPYQLELAKNGHNSCNNKVIDEMHDYAENVYLQGYNRDLVEEYLKLSQTGELCYSEGMRVHQITGSCDCMNKVCDRHDPKKVDYCNNIVLSPFTPSMNTSSAYDWLGFQLSW
ncbi:uncharacterized protein LOC121406389 [Lytechinus variegatus]|uniref:uncharacterized protein LOC121406389 n=1 Tax=Lytechinus variegatus TaxID=7654 RepID=UPI001BB1C936|nr:uncharacterized protein LOC121406389 [Lytechinus variegatus]